MEEIWKPVVGYEGMYEVSNLGRVKSLNRTVKNNGSLVLRKERILKPAVSSGWYFTIVLNNGDKLKKKTTRIHRLVATAFIKNELNKPCVNHIDNNPLNNNVSNLEWCTFKENIKHASKQGRMNRGENNGFSKLTEKQVLEIRSSNLSAKELSLRYKLSYNYVFLVKSRQTWKYLL